MVLSCFIKALLTMPVRYFSWPKKGPIVIRDSVQCSINTTQQLSQTKFSNISTPRLSSLGNINKLKDNLSIKRSDTEDKKSTDPPTDLGDLWDRIQRQAKANTDLLVDKINNLQEHYDELDNRVNTVLEQINSLELKLNSLSSSCVEESLSEMNDRKKRETYSIFTDLKECGSTEKDLASVLDLLKNIPVSFSKLKVFRVGKPIKFLVDLAC